MGCNNDKVRSFLTKPKARLRAKYDKLQQAEVDRENNFNGMTMFRAKVIGLPRDIGATVVTDNKTNDALYVGTVNVMILDGPTSSIPDPVLSFDALDAFTIINMHSVALLPQDLFSSIGVGDEVVLQFEKPYNNDTTQVPVVVSKIKTDLQYKENIKNIFDRAGGLESFFTTLASSTINEAALAQAKRRNYKIDNTEVINGNIPTSKLHFVQDQSNIIYTSTDTQGGLAFIRHPTENFATKLEQLAEAYRNAFNKPLTITSCYRSFEKQQQLYENPGPGWAARPGTSNHGWGLAFDWSPGTGRAKFSDPEYAWLNINGYAYGFYNAGAYFSNKEAWHFEIITDKRNSIYGPIQ